MARKAKSSSDEEAGELPEADRLGAFPHPRQTARLIGHRRAAAELGHALAGESCHHAWLLIGPRGLGKATLAYRAARFAMCAPAERGTPDALAVPGVGLLEAQVRALSHPGLLLIRRPYDPKEKRFKTVITVDEVRRLRGFLGHTSGDGGWRVVIIDPVDEMNGPAANALLKTLEEPPPRTLFLLVCSEPGKLLATVRSRCRVLTLEPLADDAVREAAGMAAAAAGFALPDGAALSALLTAAEGRPGRLLALASEGGDSLIAALNTIFDRLPKTDWAAAHALADEVSAAGADMRFQMFVELLSDRIAAEIRAVARAGAGDGGGARLIGSPAALVTWATLWETILADRQRLDALNLDRKSFVLGVVDRIAAAART